VKSTMGLLPNNSQIYLVISLISLIVSPSTCISPTKWWAASSRKTSSPTITTASPVKPIFSLDELRYERYAAALAATEPIRKLRDRRAKQALLPFEFWLLKRRGILSGGKGICNLAKIDPVNRNEKLLPICNQHVRSMTAIIKALGLTVSEFNALSREVSTDIELRKKVMKQAYNYRLSTDLSSNSQRNNNQLPVTMTTGETETEEDVIIEKGEEKGEGRTDRPFFHRYLNKKETSPPRTVPTKKTFLKKKLTIASFADLLVSVESLRSEIEQDVKQELHIQVR